MSPIATASAAQRLLDALPQIFRIRDREQAERIAAAQGFAPGEELKDVAEGPLFTLLTALGLQLETLEAEVDWLYDDQFIETCADWVVPYIGALVGARIIDTGDPESARLQVANTIRARRAKGTARGLADRAESVMARIAEAIEYGRYVAHTFNPNFPGERAKTTVAVNDKDGKTLGLASTISQHVVEIRDIREGGRFAPTNIGARVWAIEAHPHRRVVPSAVTGGAGGRYRFDPLGRDIAIWAPGAARDPALARLRPEQIRGPVNLVEAHGTPGIFYGPGDEQSVHIRIDASDQGITKICFCDLSDDPASGGWNERGSPDEKSKIRIDPRLGRFVLPTAGAGVDPKTVRVRYHLGSAFRIGGLYRTGDTDQDERDLKKILEKGRDLRDTRLDFADASMRRVIANAADPADADAKFKDALDTLDDKPGVRIEFGGTLTAPAATALPAAGNFELRSEEVWPTILLASPWALQGGAGSILTLRGLRLAAGDLVIKAGGLRQLTLVDCTLVPGSARLIIEDAGCKLLAVRSILGRLRVAPPVEIDLVDCLVDSGDADIAAIAALDDTAGGILWAERSTILGDVRALAIDEVSNCIFAERLGRSLTDPPVSVERLQTGCVRYSAVPRGSVAPRRYRCFPAEDDLTSPAPVFASLNYDEATYGSLVPANPDPLLLGAENHGEMGVGNSVSFHRRKRLLDADLYDWVPFGMAAITELASE